MRGRTASVMTAVGMIAVASVAGLAGDPVAGFLLVAIAGVGFTLWSVAPGLFNPAVAPLRPTSDHELAPVVLTVVHSVLRAQPRSPRAP